MAQMSYEIILRLEVESRDKQKWIVYTGGTPQRRTSFLSEPLRSPPWDEK